MNLNICLARTSMAELRAVASFNDIQVPSGISHEQLQILLQTALKDPQRLEKNYKMLTAEEREILLHILISDGDVIAEKIQRLWGGDDPETSKRWFWEGRVTFGLPRLRLMGFLFLIYNTASEKYHYILPDHVRRYVRTSKPNFSEKPMNPFEYKHFSLGLLQDVFRLVRYIDEHPVRILKNNNIPKRHYKNMTEVLISTNPRISDSNVVSYLDFIYHCCLKASLIMIRASKLVPSIRFRKWISLDAGRQVSQLFHAWYNSTTFDEFKIIPRMTVLSAGLRNDPENSRKLIIHALKQYPANRWFSFSILSQYLYHSYRHFFRPYIDEKHWHVNISDQSDEQTCPASWHAIEYNLIKFIFSGPLYWLGVVSVGMDSSKRETSFLIHEFGMNLFKGLPITGKQLTEPVLHRVIVQPNYEVIIPENAILAIKYTLEKFALLISSGPVSRYRITKQSIIYAFERGMTSDQIIAFLRKVSVSSVPENVIVAIRDWGKQYGRLTISDMVVLETHDTFLLNELQSNQSIKRYLDRPLGVKSIRIRRRFLEKLIKELKKAGYLPRVDHSLLLRWEVAPISLQLTREKADLLLRHLRYTMRDSLSGGHMIQHADLVAIIDKLQSSIQKVSENS